MVKTRRSGGADDDADDEDILTLMPQNRRRTKLEPMNDSDDSGPVEYPPRKTYNMRKKTTSPFRRPKFYGPDDDDDEVLINESHLTRQRRSVGRRRSPGYDPSEANDLNEGTRRSTRRRRMVYDTFNLASIDKFPVAGSQFDDGLARHSRRRTPSPNGKYTQELKALKQDQGEDEDMYSRVKRSRRAVKKDMYGVPVNDLDQNGVDNSDTEIEGEEKNDENEEDDETESSSSEDEEPRQYYLREHRPRTQIFEAAPAVVHRPRKMMNNALIIPNSPARRRFMKTRGHKSPAHRSRSFGSGRRRAAFHGSSSTSSSSSSSSDEERFKRRKAKSMQKSRNRCLPMNFDPEDLTGVLKDRQRIGSSLADIDPMNIDKSVTFDSVGGLDANVRALKEMIIFPLMYPEVFEKFQIQPPRGVLFHGLPGCGKTLVARALANECSKGNRKVAFFMRKGADCLSKWVGESERQLRLLFDQAYQMRPSILFFDEIDGLAPVRSSRQDQIHSSIVSTLLALMDGLDSRGEVVVIGATNRIDSIDPALRRPGRFDREFLFPLPSLNARKQILQIHTKNWNPGLSDAFVDELAQRSVGYCGADLRSLCTEAALFALRRRYPQIYTTSDKLQLDINSIRIGAQDFARAMENIVPASQRSVSAPGRALSPFILPLLQRQFHHALEQLRKVFPMVNAQAQDDLLLSDNEDDSLNSTTSHSSTYRPRLLISGLKGQGQSSHLAPALLHHMERFPTHVLDLPALYGVSAKSPEESCAQIFREAKRTSPSIIYMPHIDQWWEAVTDTLQATFTTLLQDVETTAPILLIATCDKLAQKLDPQIQATFWRGSRIVMENPNYEERKSFFEDLFTNMACKAPKVKHKGVEELEVLPVAPPPEPRQLTDKEQKRLLEQEDATLRELRLFLRDVINKLGQDRKFAVFTKPVDVEEVEDYYDVIKNPMDLSTMMSKIDLHQYQTASDFLKDIDLICTNALEYNPDKNPADKSIRHRACALRDLGHSIIENELDPDFDKTCQDIAKAKAKRGESPSKTAPNFYKVPPKPVTRLTRSTAPPMTVQSDPETTHQTTPRIKRKPGPKPRSADKVLVISASEFRAREAKKRKISPWCKPKRRKTMRRRIVVVDDELDEDTDDKDANEDEKEEEEDEKEEEDEDVKEPDLTTIEEKTEEDSETTSPKTSAKSRSRGNSPSKVCPLECSVDVFSTNSKLSPRIETAKKSQEAMETSPHQLLEARQDALPGKMSPTRSKTRSPARSPRSGSPRIISPRNIMDTSEMNGASETSSKNDADSESSMPKLSAPSPILVNNEDSNKENDLPVSAPILTEDSRKRKRSRSERNDSESESESAHCTQRVTRYRASHLPPPPLIVDKPALAQLWLSTVDKTQDFDIETLENLHCQLRECVHRHRNDYDKGKLLTDLSSALEQFFRLYFSKS